MDSPSKSLSRFPPSLH